MKKLGVPIALNLSGIGTAILGYIMPLYVDAIKPYASYILILSLLLIVCPWVFLLGRFFVRKKTSKQVATPSKENGTSYQFKDLDRDILKIHAKRWIEIYPEVSVQKVILYRYSAHKYMKSSSKLQRNPPPTKYFVILEVPKDSNTKELERATQYNQGIKNYLELMGDDFKEVYKTVPTDNEFKKEWLFKVNRPNDKLPQAAMDKEPFWVLYQ